MTDMLKREATGSINHQAIEHVELSTDGQREKSKAEKRLVLKQDFLITTLLSGAFFFAYLDRGAIGNARLLGFQESLNLSDHQYFNCLALFFVGYMAFEFPALILIRKLHAPTIYGFCTIIFGVAAIGTAYATTYAEIIILRLILGCGEAVVQSAFVYMSLWYRREELSARAGNVYLTTPLAGAVAGIIAHYVGANLDGAHGLRSWQWLFIIEGIPTIAWGILMWTLMPRLPDKEVNSNYSLFFRSEEERRLIILRLVEGRNVMDARVSWPQVLLALKDVKTWLMAYITASIGLALAAFGVFLPTFIKAFGFSPLTTQLYSIIPYGSAFISLIVVSRIVDSFNKRAIPLLILVAIAIAGFILLITTTNRVALVVGATLINVAVYPSIVICAAWIPSNHAGYTKRATAFSVLQVFIQSFSIAGTQIYNTPPRFSKGHGVLLGLLSLCLVTILVVCWIMKKSNNKKDQEAAVWRERGEVNPAESESLETLCDAHPNYRYVY
ncbi:MFS domain-containing protein [Trichoderma simmonsii]|uniref:MFS domain-containing protein n=1 Tax=Trichoderma simmonsii TaxID=1491479 RepID=A0A8G0L1E7_9HYPO|nr:MFS domain-containing protein [Trichoderma simmonsii]